MFCEQKNKGRLDKFKFRKKTVQHVWSGLVVQSSIGVTEGGENPVRDFLMDTYVLLRLCTRELCYTGYNTMTLTTY